MIRVCIEFFFSPNIYRKCLMFVIVVIADDDAGSVHIFCKRPCCDMFRMRKEEDFSEIDVVVGKNGQIHMIENKTL